MEFLELQVVINWNNGSHGLHIQVKIRTTQGGLILPTLFNMVINNVLCNWMSMTVGEKLVYHDGMVLAVGWCMGMLYVNDNLVGLWRPKRDHWLLPMIHTGVLHLQFQSHGVSAGSNPFWYFRGFCGPADHWEGGDVQGGDDTADNMPIMWGGSHSGVYDIASESNAQDGSRDRLGPASGQ